jgi:lipopolysaccharide transport system ATP-binding protein
MTPAIQFENISKQYRLGLVSTRTLSHDLNRWWKMNILGKEDPYLKIGSVNDRSLKADSEYVWALRDINFEIEQGDVVGIIGKNGAGKSTLLKILSKVTAPTTGTIKARGRIASLLEVGTGFHPEMTGRENIYMNGSIMGMRKAEITRKFDEIVDFAGVERYIDTPVKRYSSGMTVRLGFAVAAFLEPEILVVDEVLAVGDAEFQKKAIGKMQNVSKSDGRTVLFVSHNMSAIQSLCNQCFLLDNGQITDQGQSEEVINRYLMNKTIGNTVQRWTQDEYPGNNLIEVRLVAVRNQDSGSDYWDVSTPVQIEIEFRSLLPEAAINCSLVLKNLKGDAIFNTVTQSVKIRNNWQKAVVYIPENLLNDDIYTVDLYYVKDSSSVLFLQQEPIFFEIHDLPRENTSWYGKWVGAVRPNLKWDYYELETND